MGDGAGIYLNDSNPFAAAWLRNLGGAGMLGSQPCTIDERSITEVYGGEIEAYSQVHLFAGIGGWPIALQLAGWGNRPVWTGSCPCQPFSAAGKRKGVLDKRHLWPEMRRLIAFCRPATVFGEQVGGTDGRRWLAGVRSDMERIGYAVGAADLPAAGVAAPHARQRLFWVADLQGDGRNEGTAKPPRCGKRARKSGTGIGLADDSGCGNLPVADLRGSGPSGLSEQSAWEERAAAERSGVTLGLDNGSSNGRQAGRLHDGEHDGQLAGAAIGNGKLGHAAIDRRPEFFGRSGPGEKQDAADPGGGPVRLADTNGPGQRPDSGGVCHEQDDPWRSFEIVHCRDHKSRRVESGSFPLAHGVPKRTGPLIARLVELGHDTATAKRMVREARRNRIGRIAGYGNAIVPEAAAVFVRAYMAARRIVAAESEVV